MTRAAPAPIGFDAATLAQLLERLARFSADGPGVTRFTYDDAWCEAQRWLRAEAKARGLEATVDAAGNLLLHDAAVRPGQAGPLLMVGSHLDSVRHGGRYDGAYGTIAGLMLAAAHRGRTGMPVVGFVTCEEEQSRFDSHMMGARSLIGSVTAFELDSVRDAAGTTWRTALADMRAHGCAAALAPGNHPFAPPFTATIQLELHIEQGPVLEAARLELGIVEHIAGYRRIRAHLTGEARHSGTTPMALRNDALAAAAEIVLAAEALAVETGEQAVATAGNARVQPALYNVVPGECELWLEVRHAEAGALDRLARTLAERATAIARRRGVELVLEPVSQQDPTALSGEFAGEAEALAREHGVRCQRMTSGAAHDSMEFARAGARSLMLFVPSRGGVSHSPDEFTEIADLWRGVEFASALIERVTGGAR